MLADNTKAAIRTTARNAGVQWSRDRADLDALREGRFPRDLLADLVSWPCTLDEVIDAFKEGARDGMRLRVLPDMQLPGQPPQPFKVEW